MKRWCHGEGSWTGGPELEPVAGTEAFLARTVPVPVFPQNGEPGAPRARRHHAALVPSAVRCCSLWKERRQAEIFLEVSEQTWFGKGGRG